GRKDSNFPDGGSARGEKPESGRGAAEDSGPAPATQGGGGPPDRPGRDAALRHHPGASGKPPLCLSGRLRRMRHRTVRTRLLPGLLLAAVAAGGLGRAEILEEIVAKVNNSIITRSQFEERLAVYQQQLSRKYSGDELGLKTQAAADDLLRNMIMETLLVQ